MRLKTIWTLPFMSTMERLRRTQEWTIMELADRLPNRLKYWVIVGELAKLGIDVSYILNESNDVVAERIKK